MATKGLKLILASSLAWTGLVQAAVQGFDISNWQTSVDFEEAYSNGARFVIIKATEGSDWIDASFSSHYTQATQAGLIRGGYHFARPSSSSGATQATFFLAHGGGWTGDGITLPGMLDLEAGSSGQCWGLSTNAMVAWIKDFSDTYHEKTGRYPMLYTNPSWWKECTSNSKVFSQTNPLVLARWASEVGTIPGGWSAQTIWQYDDSYPYGGDSDLFNGDEAALKKFASG
ncbi:hypothetical protein JX265_008893 [Neoarthrinium moseri]|uniref:N,O-diacetylmuramidase n=1 Tax=Neoarthrinium moseri TaxID=1658444 RepID=A0A9Q0ANB0_9PEZI|nr:uncharacterized protein JN550_013201 [Neoarthrinium moseri]KAI1848326.1 hypothetical protein JX266_005632 [Neoarthrinium moseri]KAI1857383.1 hypothetical protein JN550_013201 [Neoarthrinium moseri]KAI1863676.1 hypothetical protein JX265_008893 [Neoarthrinium moseri]